jgi:hypothetical protein
MESNRRALQRERLMALLARRGVATPSELVRELGISQPTFSRLVATLEGEVRTFGHTSARRYALAREIPGVRQPIAVYEVRPRGERLRRFGALHAVGGRSYLLDTGDGERFFEDLPWFLRNARPSGFLGRLVPRRHPELGLPADIRAWNADHVLRFASRFGWDAPGAFLVGDEACAAFLREIDHPSNLVEAAERTERYPAIVADLLAFGTAGSSAAGEQPKFLATRRDGDRLTPVLVKYATRADETIGRRVADLLVAEQAALQTLGRNGFRVPNTAVLQAGAHVFLEVERFDRDGLEHRIGQIALDVLDAEFAGTDLTGWTVSAEALAARNVIPRDTVPRIRWLECFGRLIGNTDMHLGNLAFLLDGVRVTSLAPVYDMLPMHYHPWQNELPAQDHALPVLGPAVADVAGPAVEAAVGYWGLLAEDVRLSESFREVAARNRRRTVAMRPLVERLPAVDP